MSEIKNDFIIVGAGLTGLALNRELCHFAPEAHHLIIEKSKACGGRMATRRISDMKFDHGAQFLKKTEASESLLKFWQQCGVLNFFPQRGPDSYFGTDGMTQLAKKLAERASVQYNSKIVRIKRADREWISYNEKGDGYKSKNIVLTCPLPQSLEILSHSSISFESSLNDIKYSKALVVLVELESEILGGVEYLEMNDREIFSITSQFSKGLSKSPAYVVVMSDLWSEEFFDLNENVILEKTNQILKSYFSEYQFKQGQVKKWRYSRPVATFKNLFYRVEEGLYLAGDAFGGASLNGALRSAYALFDHLAKSNLLKRSHL